MTDAAPLRVNANDPIGFRAEKFEIAVKQTFTLPDSKTVISSTREESGAVKVDLPGGFQLVFTPRTETARVSPYGIVNEDRAVRQPIQAVSTSSNLESLTATQLWIAIYALWIRNYEEDVIPVSGLSEDLTLYLTHSGLGFIPDHDSKTERHVLLIRESFWQNAGAPLEFAFMRSPIPSVEHSILTPSIFPRHTSFTSGHNVATTHPLRPPKPAPGSQLYARWSFALDQLLTFTHINAEDPRHFEAYCRWQNSDRVNVGWKERGDDSHHRKYLTERLADKHIMGFMVEWDGELAGYGEIAWVKEDHLNTFVGGLGDWDQGTHLLIGEEKFRGRQRCVSTSFPPFAYTHTDTWCSQVTAIMTSMKHLAFLRDPRTQIVVGEPRADLPIIPRLIAYLPQEFNRVRFLIFSSPNMWR